MAGIQDYWRGVRATEARLAQDVQGKAVLFVTSQDDPERGIKGGVTSEVKRGLAAKLIFDRTHRLATAEEVEALRQRSEVLQKAADGSKNKGGKAA